MSPLKRNPVFWLMWMIPGAAVLAGLSMVAIAMQSADRTLPDIYHWEGERLDADFARARHAAKLGVQADLVIAAGQCRLVLRGADATTLQLRLTNGDDARLDRTVLLTRTSQGDFRGPCESLTRGKWRVALQDADNTWALRTQLEEATDRVDLRARAPEGDSA
jgi:uncharacterized protein